MVTFLWAVIVVVVGLALGAGLQLCLEWLQRSADRLIESTRRLSLVRLVLALFGSLALVFVILTAVPFGWGAVSLFLIDRLSVGVVSVYVGLVLFRLMRRAGRELE